MKIEGINDVLFLEKGNFELFFKVDGEMILEKNKEFCIEMLVIVDNKFIEIDVDSDGKFIVEELKVVYVEGDFEMMDENGDFYVICMEYCVYFEGIEFE